MNRGAVAVACIALFTDLLVYGLAIPVLPLLDATVDAGPVGTGLLFASYAAAMIVATPVAGRLVDRYGPRQPLLIGLVGLAAATLLFALGEPFWLLLLARVLQGIAAGMSWVAGLSLIAAVTPFASRGMAMGLAMSMISLGILVGPPLSGLLTGWLGTTAPFLFAAGLALLDGVLRILLVPRLPAATDDPTGPLAVLRVPGSVSLVTIIALSAALAAAIEPILPLQLAAGLGLDALGIGLVFGLLVLVSVVVNPAVGYLVGKVDARLLVAAGLVLGAAGLAAIAGSTQLWLTLTGAAAVGAGISMLSAPATTIIGLQGARTTPPALGGAYTLFNLAYAGGMMVGPAIGGALTGAFDFTTALVAIAVAVAACGAVALGRLPAARSVTAAAAL